MLDRGRLPDLYAAEPIPEAARDAIDGLLLSGDLFRYTAGAQAPVAALERDFADALGGGHALAVSSCSAALFLALRALDLPAGARVLIPAFTFAAVPSAVVHAGLTPVLVEVGCDLRLDLDDLAARLDEGAAAILISHMRGHTSDMDAILSLAAAHGLPVIEDAAHSLGTTWADRPIGTLGRIGCFSFQSYKMLNAGEGGMLLTDDADLAARAIVMSGAYEDNWRKHGQAAERAAHWQGRLPLYNMRMGNLAAAVVRPQIAALPERVVRGRANHDRLAARLARRAEIAVPTPLPPQRRAPDSIQFALNGLGPDRIGAFARATAERGVGVQVFGLTEGNARAFWNWGFLDARRDLPQTRAMLMRTCDLRLPARLTEDEVDAVADALLDALDAVA